MSKKPSPHSDKFAEIANAASAQYSKSDEPFALESFEEEILLGIIDGKFPVEVDLEPGEQYPKPW